MSIARRVDVPHGWRAWVPLLQAMLLADLAAVSQAWFFALLVPLVNLVVLVWLWSRILKRVAMSSGWAALMWMPFLNAPVLAYLASRRDFNKPQPSGNIVPPASHSNGEVALNTKSAAASFAVCAVVSVASCTAAFAADCAALLI
jgi:hypothetical protein